MENSFMTKENKKVKKGFTIIEVVLVLAIAGLIFLMVFIALPALQSSQRNTQREEDLQRVLTAVTNYSGNNSGRLPFTIEDGGVVLDDNFVRRYIDDSCETDTDFTSDEELGEEVCLNDQFRDPDGTIYRFSLYDGTEYAGTNVALDDAEGAPKLNDMSFDDSNHMIYAVVGVTCGPNEGTYTEGTGTRQVALYMVMEGGQISCFANN